jgi:hypothetical protein
MEGKVVLDFIRREPFLPFDIRTTDGRVYTVDHPAFISITRDHSVLLYQNPEDDRTLRIDTANIVTLEVASDPPTGLRITT